MTFGHLFGDFGMGALAIAELQKFKFRASVTIVGIGFEVLDDVAGLAGYGLLTDPEILTQFGAPQSFGKDTRYLQAGGAESHRRLAKAYRYWWMSLPAK